MQLRADPCVFRLFHDGILGDILTLHVDDMLCDANTRGWSMFDLILKRFKNSGIQRLHGSPSIAYLGLDLEMEGSSYAISQKTFIEMKLREIVEDDYLGKKKLMVCESKRRTLRKQLIGSLIWMLQTRTDISHRLCELACSVPECILSEKKPFVGGLKVAISWRGAFGPITSAFIFATYCLGNPCL